MSGHGREQPKRVDHRGTQRVEGPRAGEASDANSPPKRTQALTVEEEVGQVFARRGAERAGGGIQAAKAVKEGTRARVAVTRDPEEDLNLSGGEVEPVAVGKREIRPAGVEQAVEDPGGGAGARRDEAHVVGVWLRATNTRAEGRNEPWTKREHDAILGEGRIMSFSPAS